MHYKTLQCSLRSDLSLVMVVSMRAVVEPHCVGGQNQQIFTSQLTNRECAPLESFSFFPIFLIPSKCTKKYHCNKGDFYSWGNGRSQNDKVIKLDLLSSGACLNLAIGCLSYLKIQTQEQELSLSKVLRYLAQQLAYQEAFKI